FLVVLYFCVLASHGRTPCPYTTLFRSRGEAVRRGCNELAAGGEAAAGMAVPDLLGQNMQEADAVIDRALADVVGRKEAVDVVGPDRKSTRLNSSHVSISYAVFCLNKRY